MHECRRLRERTGSMTDKETLYFRNAAATTEIVLAEASIPFFDQTFISDSLETPHTCLNNIYTHVINTCVNLSFDKVGWNFVDSINAKRILCR